MFLRVVALRCFLSTLSNSAWSISSLRQSVG
jgi:hypothetical protein